MPEITLRSWNRFHLARLWLNEDLLGRHHKFRWKGKRVTIKIPTKKMIDRSYKDNTGRWRGGIVSWRDDKNGNEMDCVYGIYSVDVIIDTEKTFYIQYAPNRGANYYELLHDIDKSKISDMARDYSILAQEAFDYWVRVIRWIDKRGRTGYQGEVNPESGFGTTFIIQEKNRRLGISYNYAISTIVKNGLTLEQWNTISNTLKKGSEPPIWCEIFFEGQRFTLNNNYIAATVYFAFAAETYMRTLFMSEIPDTTNANVIEVVERSVNIRQILNRYMKNKKKGGFYSSKIQDLFNMRDDIVHHGRTEGITEERTRQFEQAVNDMIF